MPDISLTGRIAAVLDRINELRVPRTVSTIALGAILFILFLMFYGPTTRGVFAFILGVLSWFVGLLFATWYEFLRFGLVLLLGIMILVGICSAGAWLEVRWIALGTTGQGQGEPWPSGGNQFSSLATDVITVTKAILIELVLPIFLTLSLVVLVCSIAAMLLSDNLGEIRMAASQIVDAFDEGLRLDATGMEKLVVSIWVHLKTIATTLKEPVLKSTAVLGGTLSAAASLLIFMLKRRHANLDAARIMSTEIVAIARQTLAVAPVILRPETRDVLAMFSHDEPRIMTSSDRRLLLLDPGAGQAAKLPACLLEAVVRFFHADVDLTQTYNAIGSDAFTKANEERRRAYLDNFEMVWTEVYQPALNNRDARVTPQTGS